MSELQIPLHPTDYRSVTIMWLVIIPTVINSTAKRSWRKTQPIKHTKFSQLQRCFRLTLWECLYIFYRECQSGLRTTEKKIHLTVKHSLGGLSWYFFYSRNNPHVVVDFTHMYFFFLRIFYVARALTLITSAKRIPWHYPYQ